MRRLHRRAFTFATAAAAAASPLVWACSLPDRTSLPQFLDGDRRFALAGARLYFGVDHRPNATTLATVAEMDAIERDPAAARRVPSGDIVADAGGGDGLIFAGWEERARTRTVGPYSAVVERRTAYWLSPWVGALPAVLLALWAVAARGWDRFATARRVRVGRCPACGYDLRATPGRCPECGHVPKVA